MSDNNAEELAATEGHTPVIFPKGELPEPTTAVATKLAEVCVGTQRKQTTAFHTFLTSDNPPLLCLNKGDQVHVALVNVPKTKFSRSFTRQEWAPAQLAVQCHKLMTKYYSFTEMAGQILAHHKRFT